MIKLIACDLDGTTLDNNKVLDKELVRLIPILKSKGIEVTFISGRNEELLKNYIDEAGLDIPYGTNNGAILYKNHESIYTDCINQSYNNYLVQTLTDYGISYRAFTLENVYTNGASPFLEARTKYYKDIQKDYSKDIDISNEHLYKITADFYDHQDEFEEIYEKITNECKNVAFLKTDDTVYCVNSDTGNKGSALKRISELLEIDIKDTMVFGDNETDIPMFKAAGVSVAMENSDELAKNNAEYICKSNNENGVSEFIKEYLNL